MSLLSLALWLTFAAPPKPHHVAPAPAKVADSAGISLVEAYPPEELATLGAYTIAIVTVVQSSPGGTYARPPQLVVSVERALRGRVALGEQAAVWSPPPSGIDWSGPSAEAPRRAWNRTPLAAPAVGTKLIVMLSGGVPLGIESALREPWSEAAEGKWLARLERATRQRAADAEAERRAAERAVEDEKRRIASIDLERLVAKADTIFVATLTTMQFSGESQQVVPHISESLRGDGAVPWLHLVEEREQATYREGTPVLVFVRYAHWPSPFGGETDGYRLIDMRHGIVPATPERVAAVKALLAR